MHRLYKVVTIKDASNEVVSLTNRDLRNRCETVISYTVISLCPDGTHRRRDRACYGAHYLYKAALLVRFGGAFTDRSSHVTDRLDGF